MGGGGGGVSSDWGAGGVSSYRGGRGGGGERRCMPLGPTHSRVPTDLGFHFRVRYEGSIMCGVDNQSSMQGPSDHRACRWWLCVVVCVRVCVCVCVCGNAHMCGVELLGATTRVWYLCVWQGADVASSCWVRQRACGMYVCGNAQMCGLYQ